MNLKIGAAALLAAMTVFAAAAFAHTPFLMVETGSPGNVRIETGFSDGSPGAGMEVVLREKSTGRTLAVDTIPDNGVLEVPAPEVPFTVTFDAGPGHLVTKDGPHGDDGAMPEEATVETAPADPAPAEEAPAEVVPGGKVYLIGTGAGVPGLLTVDADDAIKHASVVLCFQRTADRLRSLLGDLDPTVAPDDVWLAFGLHQRPEDFQGAEADRLNRAAEIRAAAEKAVREGVHAGKTVAVLAEGNFLTSPDWAWLGPALDDLNPTIIPGVLPTLREKD